MNAPLSQAIRLLLREVKADCRSLRRPTGRPPLNRDSPVVGTGVDPVTSRFSGRICSNFVLIP